MHWTGVGTCIDYLDIPQKSAMCRHQRALIDSQVAIHLCFTHPHPPPPSTACTTGPKFNPARMTWIKPSFAWVLYRSGYGSKHNQERILKIKLPHHAVGHILSQCKCGHGSGGGVGRVQWDPARDIMTSEEKGKQPRKMLRERVCRFHCWCLCSAGVGDHVDNLTWLTG